MTPMSSPPKQHGSVGSCLAAQRSMARMQPKAVGGVALQQVVARLPGGAAAVWICFVMKWSSSETTEAKQHSTTVR